MATPASTRPHNRGNPHQLQKVCTRITAGREPVLRYRKAANQPKTVVYPNWNIDRKRMAGIGVSG